MEVGVRDLKARLSAYLQRVQLGEHITVTDRGHPIAVLTPLPGRVDLSAAADAGWLTPANGEPLPTVRRHSAARTIDAVLTEDRAE